MEELVRWRVIFVKRFRRPLPLDLEHCSPIALRAIILDVRTPADILDRIAQTYSDDEDMMRDLVRCPNLDETTLAFIALTSSEEIRTFIAETRVIDVVSGDHPAGDHQEDPKKKLNVTQMIH